MDDAGDVSDSRDVADVLATDPIAIVTGLAIANPYVVGVIFALLVLATIVLGPSTDSRFIYTDF